MVVPNSAPSCRGADLAEAVPRFAKWLVYRDPDWPRRLAESRLLRMMKSFDAVYAFPTVSWTTLRRIQRSGRPIILERINCFAGKTRQILELEYKRLGLKPEQPFDTWEVESERRQLEAADFHFAPSPQVRDSLLEIGIPADNIILSSYGWSPVRFPHAGSPRNSSDFPRMLFAGSLCVRKGVHLLLEAWRRAEIRGRLVICGPVEPPLEPLIREFSRRPDVVHLPYVRDMSPIYRDADIFAFPSLEEGGPLVSYEAMAHGLAVITSPMGAGAIVQNEVDGLVIPPHDTEAWVESLRRFARSPELCRRFGAAARMRAEQFTWDQVAKRRSRELVTRFGDRA